MTEREIAENIAKRIRQQLAAGFRHVQLAGAELDVVPSALRDLHKLTGGPYGEERQHD